MVIFLIIPLPLQPGGEGDSRGETSALAVCLPALTRSARKLAELLLAELWILIFWRLCSVTRWCWWRISAGVRRRLSAAFPHCGIHQSTSKQLERRDFACF